jgi:hypothetical protein
MCTLEAGRQRSLALLLVLLALLLWLYQTVVHGVTK